MFMLHVQGTGERGAGQTPRSEPAMFLPRLTPLSRQHFQHKNNTEM
jgi:hypothetical protein